MSWFLFGIAAVGLVACVYRLRQLMQEKLNLQNEAAGLAKKIERHRRERSTYRQSLDRSKLEAAQLRHTLDDALNHADFLNKALAGVEQPIAAVNLRQQQAVANLACIRLHGYAADICAESNNPFLQRGSDTAHLSDEAWRELNQGHLYWGTETIQRADKKKILVERRVTPILDNQGLAGYICVEEDVTNSTSAESAKLPIRSDYDVLTGLLNRDALNTRLGLQIQRAEDRQREGGGAQALAVARIDLLNLRQISKEHGQGMVDAMMIEIAQRIRNAIRAGDYAARLNHDQLAVVFHRVIDKTLATELCHRLKNSIEQRYEVGAFAIDVECAVQISLYPENGRNVDQLLETNHRWATV
jgi:diguanylate cyclase (GGDEF)-like protein/PAS domain S-box-containing protein